MARPRFGQHFLIDSSIAQREIDYADVTEDDIVLEIGPGTGIITNLLAARAKQVIAIEIDPSLSEQLRRTIPSNVLLICQDAVTVDFDTLPHFTKIVANLPFEISSPIMFKFLESNFSKAILIFQKDFAKRLVAVPKTKEYSRLTVNVSYKAHCQILEIVPRDCFSPKPRVDAAIVELIPLQKSRFTVHDEQVFFELTKHLFNHRRKKIRYTIQTQYGKITSLPFLDKRVEELTPEQIGQLSDQLLQYI
jgi:16S rRNA (adenine1518-N6/adenine1519-N6)-dimethyltransferase